MSWGLEKLFVNYSFECVSDFYSNNGIGGTWTKRSHIYITVPHHVQTWKSRSLKKFGYTQDNALLFGPIVAHFLSTCCFLKFASVNNFLRRWIVFCFAFLFYPLNSLNVLEYALVLHRVRRLQKEDSSSPSTSVIMAFSNTVTDVRMKNLWHTYVSPGMWLY